jgi:hypothetical protein
MMVTHTVQKGHHVMVQSVMVLDPGFWRTSTVLYKLSAKSYNVKPSFA